MVIFVLAFWFYSLARLKAFLTTLNNSGERVNILASYSNFRFWKIWEWNFSEMVVLNESR